MICYNLNNYKNKRKKGEIMKKYLGLICLISFFMILFGGSLIYSRYVLHKNISGTITSKPFYFEAQIDDANNLELDNKEASISIIVNNYISETEYNNFDTTYEITLDSNIESNAKFNIEITDENNGILNNGINSNISTIKFTPIDSSNIDLEENLVLKVTSLQPYRKEIDLKITLLNSALIIGDFVDYNISYIDSYSSYDFETTNGWRILDYGTKNEDGSYSNAKIISTGIPARLNYNASDNPTNTSNKCSKWWGTYQQVNEEYGLSLSAWTSGNSRYFAAYGLIHNFEKIPLSSTNTSTTGMGYYTEIVNPEATSTTTGKIFKTSKTSRIHEITLEEVNTALNKISGSSRKETSTTSLTAKIDPKALFYLRGLDNYGYSSSTSLRYWLGSPTSDASGVRTLQGTGAFSSNTSATYGIRPVITLNSDIYKENGIWQIK